MPRLPHLRFDRLEDRRVLSGGALDTSFSGDGIATADFGAAARAYITIQQPDGRYLVGGTVNADFALARFNLDGSLDTSFSSDGMTTTSLNVPGNNPSTDAIADLALRPDGKIVAVGRTYDSYNAVAIVVYNPDGTLDTTFNGDGIARDYYFGWSANPFEVRVLADNSMLVGGYVGIPNNGSPIFLLARYTPDGVRDSDFGLNGFVSVDTVGGEAYAMDVDAQGRVLLAGNGPTVARYLPDGTLDDAFAGDGTATPALGKTFAAYGVVAQPDGGVVVAGHTSVETGLMYRLTADGKLDTSFSGDGIVEFDIASSPSDRFHDLALQDDGKIVAAGRVQSGVGLYTFVNRYNADGSPDATFGTNGQKLTSLVTGDSEFYAVTIDRSGQILATGYAGTKLALVRFQSGNPVAVEVTPTTGLATTEAGGKASFTVRLTVIPTAPVTVSVATSDPSEGSTSVSTITFAADPSALDPVTVTVTGADDELDDGNVGYSVVLGAASSADLRYQGLAVDDVALLNSDDDTAGVVVTPTDVTTTEAGGKATFTVRLSSIPTHPVTVSVTTSDASEGSTSVSLLTFAADATALDPVTVTVTGVDDFLLDGDIAYSVTLGAESDDANYGGLAVDDVNLVNADGDTAGLVVTPTSVTTSEAGGQATFTIRLTAIPTSPVSVTVVSGNTAEGTVSLGEITFAADATALDPVTVTVTGVDDSYDDGDTDFTVSFGDTTSADVNFDGIAAADVTVTNTDDDSASVVVAAGDSRTTEAGGQATFTVRLSSVPLDPVTITLSVTDPTEGTISEVSLTFLADASALQPQSVTLTGADDGDADGDVAYAVEFAATSGDPLYDGKAVAPVGVVNADDEPITLVGSRFTLRRNGDAMQVLDGGGVVVYSQPAGFTRPIYLAGTSGDDVFTVNAAGTIALPGGLRVTGAGGNDRVVYVGTGAGFGTFDDASGLLAVPGLNAVLTGVEDLEVAALGEFRYAVTGANVMTIGTPSAGKTRIRGTSNGLTSVSVTFSATESVTLDTSAGDTAGTADSVTITNTFAAAGLKNFSVAGGLGSDVLTVATASLALPVAGGSYRFEAGTGVDRLDVALNGDLTLSAAGLAGPGGSIFCVGLELASLAGGSGNNKLDASAFPGSVTLNGGAGNDTLRGGSGSAVFTGGAGNDSIVGGNGSDLLIDAVAGAVVLAGGTLKAGAFTDVLSGVERASLTGGSGDDTFDVSGWTGPATLAGGGGVDRVVASGNVNMTLTNATLTRTGTSTVTLSSVERATLVGGAGNNALNAAGFAGGAVLVGGAGNDTLIGGAGRDILIGGAGADSLRGGGGDDILVGGTTSHDGNLANLASLHKEWTRADADYATRRNHLLGTQGGSLGGTAKLRVTSPATVAGDGTARDTLRGEAGTDWFFAALSDIVIDLTAGETRTTVG